MLILGGDGLVLCHDGDCTLGVGRQMFLVMDQYEHTVVRVLLQYLDEGVLAIEQIKDMSRVAGSVQNEGALGERITRLRK